jgi:hypothetical protein
MLLFSIVVFSQNKKKLAIKNIDSCYVLKNLVKKTWTYNKTKDFFKDSLGIFYNIGLYPAFTDCLINNSKKEIINLLGRPSNFYSNNRHHYFMFYLNPHDSLVRSYDFLEIIFDNKWRVKEVLKGECNSSH